MKAERKIKKTGSKYFLLQIFVSLKKKIIKKAKLKFITKAKKE
jgi:hypothetical protein